MLSTTEMGSAAEMLPQEPEGEEDSIHIRYSKSFWILLCILSCSSFRTPNGQLQRRFCKKATFGHLVLFILFIGLFTNLHSTLKTEYKTSSALPLINLKPDLCTLVLFAFGFCIGVGHGPSFCGVWVWFGLDPVFNLGLVVLQRNKGACRMRCAHHRDVH